MRRLFALMAPAFLLGAGCGAGPEPVDPAHAAAVDAWHAGRIERLGSDTGWLTLVGLHPLPVGVNSVGSAAAADLRLIAKAPATVGELIVDADGGVTFRAAPGADVRLSERPQAGPVTTVALATDREGPPTVLEIGPLLCHVIDRGGALFLRVKDRESPLLAAFTGIDRFPVSTRWRVTARLEPGSGSVPVPNALGQTDDVPSPGTLVFELGGREHRLAATGAPGADLFVVFGDASNGPTTYPGGRFLSTEPPAADGTVVLDFNRAVNPPCAFTEFATCPLPPAGNILDVAVNAGEKRWGQH